MHGYTCKLFVSWLSMWLEAVQEYFLASNTYHCSMKQNRGKVKNMGGCKVIYIPGFVMQLHSGDRDCMGTDNPPIIEFLDCSITRLATDNTTVQLASVGFAPACTLVSIRT